MGRFRGVFILDEDALELTYGPEELRDVARLAEIIAEPQTAASIAARTDLLAQVDVILSGWGGPRLDESFLQAAPDLRAMFYGGGSLSSILTDAVWDRKVVVTSALAANAVPVAEFALATILFSLKHGWHYSHRVRERRSFDGLDRNEAPGNYGSTVGLISLGATGRQLLRLLNPFDLKVIVYDPFLEEAEATYLGIKKVSLENVFEQADVISLHTPQLAETVGMIRGCHFAAMKPGATFINTARGAIVRQDEMIKVSAARPDLQFVLDVTEPEPPEPHSPLYWLPNVVLTPHIAGSVGKECRRMGRYMVDELERFVEGKPLKWAVTRESVQYTSHRPVPAPPKVSPKVSVAVHKAAKGPLKV